MKSIKWVCAITLAISVTPCAESAQLLTDTQLESITAGTAGVVYDKPKLSFDLSKTTAHGTRIGASGDATINAGSATINTGVLQLQGSAQNNLHALVNTNAVNSAVQVLINLNISINSQIGVLNQLNSGSLQK